MNSEQIKRMKTINHVLETLGISKKFINSISIYDRYQSKELIELCDVSEDVLNLLVINIIAKRISHNLMIRNLRNKLNEQKPVSDRYYVKLFYEICLKLDSEDFQDDDIYNAYTNLVELLKDSRLFVDSIIYTLTTAEALFLKYPNTAKEVSVNSTFMTSAKDKLISCGNDWINIKGLGKIKTSHTENLLKYKNIDVLKFTLKANKYDPIDNLSNCKVYQELVRKSKAEDCPKIEKFYKCKKISPIIQEHEMIIFE